jgi:hypothetical protein
MEEVDKDCGVQGVDKNFEVDENHETFGVDETFRVEPVMELSNNDNVSPLLLRCKQAGCETKWVSIQIRAVVHLVTIPTSCLVPPSMCRP